MKKYISLLVLLTTVQINGAENSSRSLAAAAAASSSSSASSSSIAPAQVPTNAPATAGAQALPVTQLPIDNDATSEERRNIEIYNSLMRSGWSPLSEVDDFVRPPLFEAPQQSQSAAAGSSATAGSTSSSSSSSTSSSSSSSSSACAATAKSDDNKDKDTDKSKK